MSPSWTAAPVRPIWRWPMTIAGRGRSPIVGTDFCREMLVLGHAKVKKAGALGRVTLVEGDTQRLPVPSNTFGVVSVAFGLAKRPRHGPRR